MADPEQHENRPYERGAPGFVPRPATLVFLTPLALAAVWLGGSLGVALVGGGWYPTPIAQDCLYARAPGGTQSHKNNRRS
ncbi:hypothetical protein ACFXGY_17200, partial [Streptomyces sp. NPDC059346]|uniref:hypothetical protein n=1 Tax=Streptomyces sp. NPDC059346 TaxID=3346807 RepID=UPI00367655CB